MKHTAVLFVCLVALALLPSLTSAVGNAVLNSVKPATTGTTNVQFHDPLYTPDGTLDAIKTDTFQLLNQFQLLVDVPAITLNGGSGGLSLSSSLGASLDAGVSNSVFISSSSGLTTTSDYLQLQSNRATSISSTAGNVRTVAGEQLEVLGNGITVAAANAVSKFSSTGPIDINAINNAATLSADTVTVTLGTDLRLTSEIRDVEIAGETITSSSRLLTVEGTHDAAFYSDNNATVTATSTASFSSENLELAAVSNLTVSGSSTLSVSGEQLVDLHSNAVALTGGSVSVLSTGSGVVEIKTTGAFNVAQSTGITVSAAGAAGAVVVSGLNSVTLQAQAATLTATVAANIGSGLTAATSLLGSTVNIAGASVISDSITTSLSTSGAIVGSITTSAEFVASGISTISSPNGAAKFSGQNKIVSGPLSSIAFSSATTGIATTTTTVTADGNALISTVGPLSVSTVTATLTSAGGYATTISGATTAITSKNKQTYTTPALTAHIGDSIQLGGVSYTSSSRSGSFSAVQNVAFQATGGTFSVVGTGRSNITLSAPGKGAIADIFSDSSVQLSGNTITAQGTGAADMLATTSFAVAGENAVSIGSDTTILVDSNILQRSFTVSSATTASNINFLLTNLNFLQGSVKIQSGQDVKFVAGVDVSIKATAGQFSIDTDGGLELLSGSDMSIFGTNTAGALAGSDLRLTSAQNIVARAFNKNTIESSGDVALAAGQDFLVTGTLAVDADINVSFSAKRDLLATGDSFAATGDSFYAKSGYGKVISLKSGANTVITANAEAPRLIEFTGQSTQVESGGPLSITAKTMTLSGVDVIVSAANDINYAATVDAVIVTKSLSYTGANLVEFQSFTSTLFQSGEDRYINGTIANGILFQAQRDVDVSSASDINLFATEDFKLTGDEIQIGAESKLEMNANRTISLFSLANIASSININSGGAVTVQSAPGHNIAASTAFSWTASAQNQMEFTGDGGNSAGCGIDIQVGAGSSTSFQASQLWGVVHGRSGVAISSTAPAPGTSFGDLRFTSTKDAFFHAEDGAVFVIANDKSQRGVADALLVSSSSANGDIAVTAIQASIVNFGRGISINAVDTKVNTGDGVDVYATGGDITLSTTDLFVDGARALNISAGSVSPPISGVLSFTSSQGPVTAQADSEIRITSQGKVNAVTGTGVAISGKSGVAIQTSNGFDLQANAAGGVSFKATATTFGVTTVAGDIKVDSNAGDLSFTAVDQLSVSALDGPLVISAGGVNGFATFESTNKAWVVKSTDGSVSIKANTEARLTATNQINVQSGSGSVLLATNRPVDNIIISSTDITASTSGVRRRPEDHLSVFGNNIDLLAQGAIQFVSEGLFYIGNSTTPVVSITASQVSFSSNDGLRMASDRQVRITSSNKSSFLGTNGLLVSSLDAMSFSTVNPTQVMLAKAKLQVSAVSKSGSIRAPGDITIDGGAQVTLSSSGARSGDGILVRSESTIYHKATKLVQLTGATFDATQDVGAARFVTGSFTLRNQAPTSTFQNDLDPSYISVTSQTTTSLTAAGSIQIDTSNPNGTLSFVTTAAQANLLIDSAGPLSFTTTGTSPVRSNFAVDANTVVVSAVTPLSFTASDPTAQRHGNITVRANGNIVGTSATDKVQFTATTGGIVFETTDRPTQLVIKSGTASPVTVTAGGNITLSTRPESLSDLTIKTIATGPVTFKANGGATSLVQLQALGGQLNFQVKNDAEIAALTWSATAQRGVLFQSTTTTTLESTSGNMQFRTNSSNSDINFESTTDLLDATCTDAACVFVAKASQGLSITATNAAAGVVSITPGKSFQASATGTTSLSSSLATTLTVGDKLIVSAAGYDATNGIGIGIRAPTVDLTATTTATIQATEEVAFIQLKATGSTTLGVAAEPLTFAAQGNDGKILLHSIKGDVAATFAGLTAEFVAGSNFLASGGQNGIVLTAPTLNLKTINLGSSIVFENDDVAVGSISFNGKITSNAAATVLSADDDAIGLITFTASDKTVFQSTLTTGVPLQVVADLGDILFPTGVAAAVVITAPTSNFLATTIDLTPTKLTITGNTANFVSTQGSVTFTHTGGAATEFDILSATTTGVGFGSDIQFSGTTVKLESAIISYQTLRDRGEIFVHADNFIKITQPNSPVTVHGRGGVHFLNEHSPDAVAAGIALGSGTTTNAILATWGLADQVDFESDLHVELRSPNIGTTNYQGTLGFFSKTPSPLHVASRWSSSLCNSTPTPTHQFCGAQNGIGATNYEGVLDRLDAVLSELRNVLIRHGLLDWTLGSVILP